MHTKLTRRLALTGAAWSAPIIVLAVSSPLAAASQVEAIAFAQEQYWNEDGSSMLTVQGVVPPGAQGVARPTVVQLEYGARFSGPATASVDPATGVFTIDVVCPTPPPGGEVDGVVTATATGWAAAIVRISVVAPGDAGRISFNPVQYRGVDDGNGRVYFPTLTGTVVVNRGRMPAEVVLSFSSPDLDNEYGPRVDLRRDAGLYVPIDLETGAFSVDGVYNSVTGGPNPFGFIYAGVHDAGNLTYGLATAELDG